VFSIERWRNVNVCYWHKADILNALTHFGISGASGISNSRRVSVPAPGRGAGLTCSQKLRYLQGASMKASKAEGANPEAGQKKALSLNPTLVFGMTLAPICIAVA
jgi:hypothetical protein